MTSGFFATFVRPYRWRLLVVVLVSVMSVGCALAQPLAMQELLTDMDTRSTLAPALVLLIGLTLGEAVFTGIHTVLLQHAGAAAVYDVRSALTVRLLRWPLTRYAGSPRGELVTLLTTDSTRMHLLVTAGVFEIAAASLLTVGAAVLMAILSPTLSLVAGLAIVVVVVAVTLSSRSVRARSREAQDQTAVMAAEFASGLEAIRTVRTAGATDRVQARVLAPAARARDAARGLGNRLALVNPLAQLATQGAFLAVLAVGGLQVSSGVLRAGDLLAFLMYVVLLLSPVESGLMAIPVIQQARGSWDRIHEALATPLEPGELTDDRPRSSPRPGEPEAPALQFDRVSFSYPGGSGSLTEASFTVPSRTLCVIVGPSGAGKSTLLDLAARLRLPDFGTVSLGGRDLRELTRAELCEQVSYMEQATPLVSATLSENLRLAEPGASVDAMVDALRSVGLVHLLDLPDGLQTRLGEGGHALSGGETQRLGLARAVLSTAPVLLVDEPTSRLDPDTEALVHETLRREARSRTVLLATHRPQPFQQAQQAVFVTRDGVVTTGQQHDLQRLLPSYGRLEEVPLVS